tara:strand:- start:264 stop:506 length:243 start_codon:yes stop_codon:yes gene_type:complete
MNKVDLIFISILGFMVLICFGVCIYELKDLMNDLVEECCDYCFCGICEKRKHWLIERKNAMKIMIFPEIKDGPNKGIRLV